MRRTLIGLGFLLALMTASPVLAHANLVRSDPPASTVLATAPEAITLWFTEPLEPDFSSIILLDADGSRVEMPPSVVAADDPKQMSLVLGALPDGLYTVSWRVISAADGHSTRGSFAFAIGAANAAFGSAAPDTETIPPLSAPVRWLNLLSLSLAVGSVAFAVSVWRAPLGLQSRCERRMRSLMRIGWALVGIGGGTLLFYQVMQATDAALPQALGSLSAILTETRFGWLWLARMVVWVVMGAALWRWRYGIALAAGGTLLLLHSFYSHASATYDLIPAVASDWLHLAATAFWVGGLAQFLNVLLALRGSGESLAPLVARFSNYARVCVGALVVTGVYAAWLEVGTIDALLNTLYGRALVVKLILFVPLLAIAAVNLLLTGRGLRGGKGEIWGKRLRGLVAAEITLTLGIFAAVAVMASADPARSSLARRLPPPDHSYADFLVLDDLHVHLEVSPGWLGQNEFTVLLLNLDGSPVDDASLIRLRFDNQTRSVGRSELRPAFTGDGEYTISGANLSTPGEWRARVTVQRPGKFDALADFMLDMQPAPAPPGLDMSVPLGGRELALMMTGLALLALGGFAGGRGRYEPLRNTGLLVTAAIITGLLILLAGVV